MNFKQTFRILVAVASLLVAQPAAATWPSGYYDRMEGKTKENLKSAAKACVSNHSRLDYYSLPAYWQYTDVYPELVDGSRRWWEMYSNAVYLIGRNQSANSSFSANKMQREHSIPKSWWKKAGDVEYTPAYTDMWNLYPSDGTANQAKSNYPFGEVREVSFDNGCTRVGQPVSGQGGGCGMVFEPADQYKGDFARTIFYMATVYDDLPWVINYMFTANSPYPTLRPWATDMLLQWARRDPVSQKEIDRNDGVQSQQGNRNPFIDFPELAEYIWGTRTSEVFRISEQGGSVTPPITGDPEITTPVNGEALDFGQVAVGQVASRILEIRGANLSAPLSIALSGTDRKMFSLETTEIPASTINSSGIYRLTVFYQPTVVGTHSASVVIFDGGLPGGQSIGVQLLAEGCEVPQLSAPVATPATEITSTSYTANWNAIPQVADYYLLNRVRYYDDGEEGDLMETTSTSVKIEGRDASVTESYQVMAVRLGIRSEASNTILVAADTSVGQLAGPGRTSIVTTEDGFRIVTDLESVEVCVYDAAGRVILRRSASNSEVIRLQPNTFYLISATGLKHPVKLSTI